MAKNLFSTLMSKITDNTYAQEENNMAVNETINNATNNEAQEETTMTRKEKFLAMKEEARKKALAASNKTGYGIGYGATTVKLEAKGLASKVKDAVCGTAVVSAFTDGLEDGSDKALEDYADRCKAREEKRRAKLDAKALKEAIENDDCDFEPEF